MTMPVPLERSAKPWYWASSAPVRPTMALPRARPPTLNALVLMELARLMASLSPTARMARPASVRKNPARAATATATTSTTKPIFTTSTVAAPPRAETTGSKHRTVDSRLTLGAPST